MSSLYKIFSKNIKKKPNKIFIYSFNETFNGHNCKKKINFLRRFIKKHNIKNIGINYKNSADWFFWYLAADSYNCQVVLIKNGTPKNELNKIKAKYQIDYIAGKIPQTLNLKLKIKNNNENRRRDILFTSGSLSLPKGVIVSEKAYLHVAKILVNKLKQNDSDIELLSMPFDHSFGLVRLRCCILAGTKIFITCGEHDLSENIIHLVLARTPNAPPGIKGISLFLVPKFLPNENGDHNLRNKLECGSIEKKMGIHASPTCVMHYNEAKGWLVGDLNKGMRAMFIMMNGARLFVGIQGLGLSETAYQSALYYSKERLQGKLASSNHVADPILVHPEIRKNLLYIKSINEAVCSPGLIPGINAPPFFRFSAISLELKVNASQM